MKKAGVVILYNPNIEDVKKNITSYLNYLDKLYIVDNSSLSNELCFSGIDDKIEYLANLSNQGIPKVLNKISEMSILGGYDLLLTMDQDSYFKEDSAKLYFNFIDKLDFNNISMVGVTPVSVDDYCVSGQTEYSDCQLLITSGSFVNLHLLKRVGGFNEKLFIDCIDYDYCLRSLKLGFRIGAVKSVYLTHVGGSPKIILGKKIALYSSERLYFIIRNHFYLWIKYFKKFPLLIIKNIVFTFVFCFLPNFIFSKQKISFLRAFKKATADLSIVLN